MTGCGRVDQEDEIAIVRVRDVGRWEGDIGCVGFTVHVDEGIWQTCEVWVFTAYDDCSCAETLCFSDLVDKGTVTALHEGDPGLLWVRTMRTDGAERGTCGV